MAELDSYAATIDGVAAKMEVTEQALEPKAGMAIKGLKDKLFQRLCQEGVPVT